MTFYTFKHTQQWRQKWEFVADGKPTGQFFHTWHVSKDEAYAFVIGYVRGFGDKVPQKHYKPIGSPGLRTNKANEPTAVFITNGTITLAPL